MKIIEHSKIGEKVLENKSNILIGLSVKNSYFKEEKLRELIRWSCDNAKQVFIMIPDEPAVFTLMSFGYDEVKAKAKARLEANRLENKCNKIISEHDIKNAFILRWEDFKNNENYVEYLSEIKKLYEEHTAFKEAVRLTTEEVVLGN